MVKSRFYGLMLVLSLAAGAAMSAWVVKGGSFVTGWLVTSLFLVVGWLILFGLWKIAGGGKLLAWMVALAFLLRLGSGLVLTATVKIAFANGTEDERAGYIFTDAYNRDQAAWVLARSSTPILTTFRKDFVSDQYGGLLALSAVIYRYLSPDVQRPYLIQILAALAAAMGVPFFWAAVRKRWNTKIAQIATWLLVLYPESVLLGSYQMREPFLISLAAIAFWAVVTWPQQKLLSGVVFAGSLGGMALISSQIALPVAGFCLVWLFLDWLNKVTSLRGKVLAWTGLVIIGLAMLAISWEWLYSRTTWDILVTIHNSGILQSLISTIGDPNSNSMRLFVIAYGILQPVLPAALIDPGAKAVMQVVGILRARGLVPPAAVAGL